MANYVKTVKKHLKSKSFSASERAVDDMDAPSDLVGRGVGVCK